MIKREGGQVVGEDTHEGPSPIVENCSLESVPNRTVRFLGNTVDRYPLQSDFALLFSQEPPLTSSCRFGEVGKENEGQEGEDYVDRPNNDVQPLECILSVFERIGAFRSKVRLTLQPAIPIA